MIQLRQAGLVLVCAVVAALGCQTPNEITWSAQSASADGAWLALAHTEHTNHGFGGESIWTSVELRQNFAGATPVRVVEIEEDRRTGEEMDLKIRWPTPSHLDVTYRGNQKVTFQAVKAFGLDVTVEQLSNQ